MAKGYYSLDDCRNILLITSAMGVDENLTHLLLTFLIKC